MSEADGRVLPFSGDVGDAANVLLLAPTFGDLEDEACSHLMAADPDTNTGVLGVTLTDAPDERIAIWQRRRGPTGHTKYGFITVGDTMRSAAAAQGEAVSLPAGHVRIESISTPADLTGIGIKLTALLAEWPDDGEQVTLCFHSLTTLLQYVDLQDVFRFFHVLTSRMHAADARAHYHMDSTAHDERTVNTLKSLFDAVVEFSEGGGWVVRTR